MLAEFNIKVKACVQYITMQFYVVNLTLCPFKDAGSGMAKERERERERERVKKEKR